MKYTVDLDRELDYTQLSIASSELCATLSLIEKNRNNVVEFNKYVKYAKELQQGILNMEVELKSRLKEILRKKL